MPILTKQDLVDDKLTQLSVNVDARQIDPAIAQTVELNAFEYLPHGLCEALVQLHYTVVTQANPLTSAQQGLKTYFDLHLKKYYLMQTFLNYLESSEAIQTASGFRTFKELQSDKASADVYAQLLSRIEKLRDAARNRARSRLTADKYTIAGVIYSHTQAHSRPIRQRHFNVILPADSDYEGRYLSNDFPGWRIKN